jgi:hypothetical protein
MTLKTQLLNQAIDNAVMLESDLTMLAIDADNVDDERNYTIDANKVMLIKEKLMEMVDG